MVSPIQSLSLLGLVFCLVNDNSSNCMSGLVLLYFYISKNLNCIGALFF